MAETALELLDRMVDEDMLSAPEKGAVFANMHACEAIEEFAEAAAKRAVDELIAAYAPRCRTCQKRTEPERWCYATPRCFACLPPPAPIATLALPEAPGTR